MAKHDPDGMNDKRADWARQCIELFRELTGSDSETALQDLLCDLMHFGDQFQSQGYQDFETALSAARHHYESETAETP